MKFPHFRFLVVAVLLVVPSAWAQSVPDAKQQVLELEQVWVTAEHNRDEATLRRILDDKFVASFNAEKPVGKEAFIKSIVTGEVDLTESQTLTDRNVIID